MNDHFYKRVPKTDAKARFSPVAAVIANGDYWRCSPHAGPLRSQVSETSGPDSMDASLMRLYERGILPRIAYGTECDE